MQLDHDDPARGEMPEAYEPHFSGSARFQHFESPFEPGPAVFAVHFDAGSRTKPHLHHSGQVLFVTEGEGVVGTGDGRRTVRPGDLITIRPDEWHWHGATPTTAMTHLTVQMPGAEDVEWRVDDRDWAAGYE